ncbi:hypothetical protein SASPL_140029 [Salvia splendens]|uniref:4-nitrophenyl phosphatase n=1 Tax=Salvia splendens TaxID=180675 RepID=A0A8X8ZBK1_SALSN|nr:patellin-5-like [Salvia splendens]KAG6398563.1 hypothetical protein SASPL_140029 [Salvia splendens]
MAEAVVMEVPEAEETLPSPENTQDKAPLPTPPPAQPPSKLPETETKSLQELKNLLRHALLHHTLSISSTPPPPQTIAMTLLDDADGAKTLEAIEETVVTRPQEASIFGVKLLEDDERSDVVLLKFLRARDLKPKDAFAMLDNTLKWRKDFGIDNDEEESEEEFEKAVFMHGRSKDGHPVCYNVYGEFRDGDEEKRRRFLRWRVGFMEKSVRNLDFRHGGVSTIVQVNDLNNSPGFNRWELIQALHLFQDNYPEFVAKQIFINVPWWYLALSKMMSPFLTQRIKTKFVVAGPSKSAHTLFKYISAEEIPAQCGGLSKEGEFEAGDSVTEILVKPSSNHIVEIPVNKGCVVSWEARVVGWDVSYGAEFVPRDEDGYTIIIQKNRRIGGKEEEQVVCSRYNVCDDGKLLLTFNNLTSKNKMLLYRFKTKLSH